MTDLTELTPSQVDVIRRLLDERVHLNQMRAKTPYPESDSYLSAQLVVEDIQQVFRPADVPVEEPYRYLTGEDMD